MGRTRVAWRRLLVAGVAGALASGAGAQAPGCQPASPTWCDAVGAACTSQVPGSGLTDCDVRVARQWSFNEAAYCLDCRYTFYVLVECGREMHLPLSDMEGGRVTVTEVLNGRPATLRCLNDAAKGSAPEIIRCVGPGGRRGYGPAFDESSAGGTISWGFPDCVDATQLTCADVPAGGGPVDRASPGEMQVMDCSVSAPGGLCGLYRVDIESGGFEWDLFANCDGSTTPGFEIFFDCNDALAAFRPLPELAIANATAQGACPSLAVTFDLQNLGCADFSGSVPIRVSTDCVPPETVDVIVTDPVPAGGSVTVSVPLDVSCNGIVVIEVDPPDLANPTGQILECTEDPTAASCRQASGVDSLAVAIACCLASITPRAGDGAACEGGSVLLDGSASTIAGCALPLYRWLDAGGAILRDWDPVPATSVQAGPCPAGASYLLDVACDGEACAYRTVMRVDCIEPVAVAGADVAECPGTPVRLDASGSVVSHCASPEIRWLKDGVEIRTWDPDPALDLGALDCAQEGTWQAEIRCAGQPCAAADSLTIACTGGAAPAEVDPALTVTRSSAQLSFDWPAVPGADRYRLVRGTLSSLRIGRAYDHAADDAIGRGACDTGTAVRFVDADDGLDGQGWYYLVLATRVCGGDGPSGFGRDSRGPFARPGRLGTPGCP